MSKSGESGAMMFVCRDRIPLWRVDVSSLFGKYLSRLGWEVRWHAVFPDGQCRPEWMPEGALTSTSLKPGRLPSLRLWITERVRDVKAARALMRNDPGVVVVRDDFFSLVVVGLAARLNRVPCVYWMSFLMEDGYVALGRQTSGLGGPIRVLYGRVYGLIGRIALRKFTDLLFVQSEVMADIVATRTQLSCRIVPVHMGVDFERLQPLSVPANDSSGLVLGYTGAMSLLRGFDVLIRGFALARSNGVPVRLVLVGWYETQVDQVALERLIGELELADAIEHVGRQTQDAAFQLIANCDLGLSPCPSSPLYLPASPTKLYEYLALGKMVIATDHPVQRAVVEEASAGWVVEETAAAYAIAIAEAHSLKLSGVITQSAHRISSYCRERHGYEKRALLVDSALRFLLNSKGGSL